MCGFSGIFSSNKLEENDVRKLKQSLTLLEHRGPDDRGLYVNEGIGLAHARLSILDLSQSAHQPMTDAEDRYVLVYNGECYNYKSIRKDLEQHGEFFLSTGDTEVVLKLLKRKGFKGLAEINGFFALAFYDRLTQELLLARDAMGIKPLYYSQNGNTLCFSSEMKPLLVLSEKQRLDKNSLEAYFHLNYVPAPFSITSGIKKVPPGSYTILKSDQSVKFSNYTSMDSTEIKDVKDASGDNLMNLIETSVRDRLISDVPLGTFLSGGLDSSIITAMAARHQQGTQSFTMVFKGSGQYDESADAAQVAKALGTHHNEVEISENDLLMAIPEMLNKMDEPFADSSAIATNLLSKEVKKSVGVALSGDGADELFGGYHKHRALLWSFQHPIYSKLLAVIHPIINQLPSSRESGLYNAVRSMERLSRSASKRPDVRYWDWAGYGNPVLKKLLHESRFGPAQFLNSITGKDIKNFDDCLETDLKMVLEGDMLVKTDRYSMRNGLEVRVPMLDRRIVRFARRLAVDQKVSLGQGKLIMREAAKKILPLSVINKKKHGFEVPLKQWLNRELETLSIELLNPQVLIEQGLFNINAVSELQHMVKKPASNNAEYAIWNLMVFNQWWLNNREYLDYKKIDA
ncbi:MAG: asparagine synthase (glutamine-hydrolyzing) [Vicingaceae bacterium]